MCLRMVGKRLERARRSHDQSQRRPTLREFALRSSLPGVGTPRRNPAVNPRMTHHFSSSRLIGQLEAIRTKEMNKPKYALAVIDGPTPGLSALGSYSQKRARLSGRAP